MTPSFGAGFAHCRRSEPFPDWEVHSCEGERQRFPLAAAIAKILFVIFLVLLIVSFIMRAIRGDSVV